MQKSGIMEAFSIAPGDELLDYNNLEKAAQLLEFLTVCFQEKESDDANLERWRSVGQAEKNPNEIEILNADFLLKIALFSIPSHVIVFSQVKGSLDRVSEKTRLNIPATRIL